MEPRRSTTAMKSTLEQLGLVEYLASFENEGFDDTSFLLLTEADLEKIVPRIGHRRSIISAVIALRDNKVYICFLCKNNYNDLNSMLMHFRVVHQLGEKSIYKCVHCWSSYNRHSFLRHYRNIFKMHFFDNQTPDQTDRQQIGHPKEQVESGRTTVESESLENYASKFMASTLESGKVPISTGETILLRAKELILEVVQRAKQIAINIVKSEISIHDKIDGLNEIDKLNDPFQEIDTRYKLEKHLKSQGYLILPDEVVLDTDIAFQTRKNTQVQFYKPVTMQYVPIKKTLKRLLEIPGFYSMLDSKKTLVSPDVYKSFRDGSFCRECQFTKDTIFITIFYDDAEVANPLGSKSGRHKLSNFYFSVLDLPSHYISSTDNIHLLCSLKSDDFKEATPNRILQIIVDELLELWSLGITFSFNGYLRNVKVVLSQLSGDNLGLHALLGFSEGFTANRSCRRCRMHREECRVSYQEDLSQMRTLRNYTENIAIDTLSVTGLKFETVINKLPYHHVTEMVVFDIMHDVFEGVGPDLFKKLFNYGIERKYFTIDKLNFRLESFNYGRHYNKSKPSLIKLSYLKGETISGQSASQSICLSMCLPLILGDIIPTQDTAWGLFFIYREIVDLLLSSTISQAGLIHLNLLISEYCLKYQDIFKDTLKPKHHHMLHYSHAIERIGPLKQFWCMPYEARHKYFKTVAHVICNFRNIPKSLAYRFQLSSCFRLMSISEFNPCSFKSYGEDTVTISELNHSDEISNFFDKGTAELVSMCKKMSYNNSDYQIGTVVLLSNNDTCTNFGKIEAIFLENNGCTLLVDKLLADCCTEFAAYSLVTTNEIAFIEIDSLLHHTPLYKMTSFNPVDSKKYVLPFRNWENTLISISSNSSVAPSNFGGDETSSVISSISKITDEQARELGLCILPSQLTQHQNSNALPGTENERIQSLHISGIPEIVPTLINFETPKSTMTSPVPKRVLDFVNTSNQSDKIDGFDLKEVLLADLRTRDIIAIKIPQRQFILRADRQAIAAVLIDFVIKSLGTNPSKQALCQLAKHLVGSYPSLGDPRKEGYGWQMWYFYTPLTTNGIGFLEERLKSQRAKLNKTKPKVNSSDNPSSNPELNAWISEHEDENPDMDEAVMKCMQSNFSVDVKARMHETVFQRRTFVRKSTNVKEIMERMPRLFDIEGMIVQDFDVRHPKIALQLYKYWPTVSKLLVQYCEESHISGMKKLDCLKPVFQFTEDDFCLAAFAMLAYALPLCSRKPVQHETVDQDLEIGTRKSSRPRKPSKKVRLCMGSQSKTKQMRTVKASDLDCRDSLIVFRAANSNVKEILSENKQLEPFILALEVCSTLSFESFFVIIDKVAVPCGNSFISALDTCFKSFTVLNVEFPLQSKDQWKFIESAIYQKPLKVGELPPVVQALIGQIMPRVDVDSM